MGPVTKKELCLNHTLNCAQERFRPLARGETHVSGADRKKKKKSQARGFFCLCKCMHCRRAQHFSPQELLVFSVVKTGCKCWHNSLYFFSSFHHHICLLLPSHLLSHLQMKKSSEKKNPEKQKPQPNISAEVFQCLSCHELWLIVKISLPSPYGKWNSENGSLTTNETLCCESCWN